MTSAAYLRLLKNNINAVPGDVTDTGHVGWIKVLSWSYGRTADLSPGSATPPTDLSLIKTLDRSSPKLMMACANGEHFDRAELEVVAEDKGASKTAQKVTLDDVLVSGVQLGGSSDGRERVESVGLNFKSANFKYF